MSFVCCSRRASQCLDKVRTISLCSIQPRANAFACVADGMTESQFEPKISLSSHRISLTRHWLRSLNDNWRPCAKRAPGITAHATARRSSLKTSFMTELESHLLQALKRLEAQYESRNQTLANTLKTLTAQLETLSAQLNALTERFERLRATMKQP